MSTATCLMLIAIDGIAGPAGAGSTLLPATLNAVANIFDDSVYVAISI
jgi:hypothetical protein